MTLEVTGKMDFMEYMNRCKDAVSRKEIVKIGSVELLPEEVAEIYEKGLFVITQHSLYEVQKTKTGRFTGNRVYKTTGNLNSRGRYSIETREQAENLIRLCKAS